MSFLLVVSVSSRVDDLSTRSSLPPLQFLRRRNVGETASYPGFSCGRTCSAGGGAGGTLVLVSVTGTYVCLACDLQQGRLSTCRRLLGGKVGIGGGNGGRHEVTKS